MTIMCEWGPEGVRVGCAQCDVVVIVDVLSFSTTVDVAVAAGATVFPYRYRDESAVSFAAEHAAELAGPRRSTGSTGSMGSSGEGRWSLSPASMQTVPAGFRVVLPSPNGSTLCVAAGDHPAVVGCLRNASAVAEAAMATGDRIAVIPAGERWEPDNTLRPALEDWLGAGAILSAMESAGRRQFTPDARAAIATFRAAVDDDALDEWITNCPSGQELITRGFPDDVRIATALNASNCVPELVATAGTRPIINRNP